MNEFDLLCKQNKTVDEIKLPTWNKIIEILDLSPDNDWENIARYFPKYFTQFDIARIKNETKKSNYSPSQAVLEVLRNNLVPITRLYKCFVDFQLIQACNYLEKDFPNEAVYKRNQQTLGPSQAFSNLNNNSVNIANNTREETKQFENQEAQFKNLCLTDISNQNQPPNLDSPQQTALLMSVKNLIDLYEEILPVVHENKPPLADPILMSSSSSFFDSSLPVSLRIFGKFEICYINERKLSFKKREFTNPFDYIRELKMIKHRHLNLYTSECILKNSQSNNYFLLYNYETYPTKLLTEYAGENLNTLLPSQYNTHFQLTILRDVACALTYLHERMDSIKKSSILHGNLQPDCILVEFRNKDQISAKLFDFTSSIEFTDMESYESKIKDEFYRFGQLIFMVSNWRYLDRYECDNIHNQRYEDLNQYQYTLYRQFNMDKHANSHISQTLLRMFFALTSSNYDTQKGIKKSYDFLKDLLEKLIAEKNKSLWT